MTTVLRHPQARLNVQFLVILSTLFFSSAHSQWVPTGAGGQNIHALAGNGTSLFAGSLGQGVYRSTNNGTSWVAVDSGLTNGNIISLATSGDTIFAGTGAGIFRSSNDGGTWTPVNTGLTAGGVRSIVIWGAEMFAGTNGGVFRSTNGGDSWTSVLVLDVSSMAHSETMLFAGDARGVVYRSTDHGVSWDPMNNGFPNIGVSALVVSQNNLIASTFGAIYRSSDDGENWINVSDGLSSTGIHCLSVVGTNLLAGGALTQGKFGEAGVFRSGDDCAVWWGSFATGLPADWVEVIASVDSKNMFLGTVNNGVWRRRISDMDTTRTYPSNKRGIIRGSIYYDANGNGALDSAERTATRKFIELSGKQSGITMSDCDGNFSFSGLDSGSFTISLSQRHFPWYATAPPPGTYNVTRNVNDSSGYFVFGIHLAHGKISGKVFNDENHSGIQDSSESAMSNVQVDLAGRGVSHVSTDGLGNFSFVDLPPGTYSVAAAIQLPWQVQSPPGNSYTVALGLDDSSMNNNFAFTYPWGSLSGTIFRDNNENGMLDSSELPLRNWIVKLGGDTHDSTVTDSSGRYIFPRVDRGLHVVYPSAPLPWENVPATHNSGDTIIYTDYDRHAENVNFALHIIPKRVRLKLTVNDNTQFLRRDIFCGVRSGTTGGIWGADGHATNLDYSEGESELPPHGFAVYLGLFDARFMDPGNGIGWFGEGSWTDMRNFYWPEQTDIFRIAILPGYSSGGDYPITIRWSGDSVRACYVGPVTLDDQHGTILDMKSNNSMVVTNGNVHFLLLTARAPRLPATDAARWELLSSPTDLPASIFPSATSALYAYSSGGGYAKYDSLREGSGYWLKFSRGRDTIPRIEAPRLKDTIHLALGWNLIGALGVPVDVRSVLTSPSDLVGKFYYFDSKYFNADSIKPEYGYWVKANRAGDLFLDANAPSSQAKREDPLLSFRNANVLHITDALGREQLLYFGSEAATGDRDRYEMPPLPPAGVFDVRFATNRCYESGTGNITRTIPIQISSAIAPITVRWEVTANGVIGSLFVGAHKTQLISNGNMVIADAESSIVLSLGGQSHLPIEFGLEQNYPNPFNPLTTIKYQLPVESEVSLKVCNILGQVVAELVGEVQTSGYKAIEWNAANVASGMYFYRLDATPARDPGSSFTQVRKMLLVK